MSQPTGYTSPNAPQQPNPYGQQDQYRQEPQHGGTQQYGQPDQYGEAPQQRHLPPPEEPKKSWFARHKVITEIGAVIALIVVASVFSGGGEDDAPSAAETTDASEDAATETSDATDAEESEAEDGAAADVEDAAADDAEDDTEEESEAEPEESAGEGFGIGEVAQDGKFEFVVTEVETGVEQVGSEYRNATAQGQLVLVHLEVTNVGNKAQTLYDSSQHLIDTDGREHSADSSAGIYIEDNKVLLNEINPGNTLSGVLVFDIPADATPASVDLHDSMFSGGVTISLE